MTSLTLPEALERAILGDPFALSDIAAADQASIQTAAKFIGEPLILKKAAVARVLRGLLHDEFTPSATQAWASFMRRGFSNGAGGPIRPIAIEYESAWEDAVVEAVSRLDEIGDLVDGEVAESEVHALLALLGE